MSPIIAYVVLLVAFLLEGWSTLEAFKEFRAAKGKLGWFEAIRRSKDPPAFIVLLENGAAMAGIVAAAVGLVLAQVTGDPFYDGAASVVIGIILGLTAFLLAYESKGLLIGEAADPRDGRGDCASSPAARQGVVGVGQMLTVHTSPDQITAMMNVDFDDRSPRAKSSGSCARSRNEARERWPQVRRLFIRPMQGAADQLEGHGLDLLNSARAHSRWLDRDKIRKDFAAAVNMTADEIDEWLDTDESHARRARRRRRRDRKASAMPAAAESSRILRKRKRRTDRGRLCPHAQGGRLRPSPSGAAAGEHVYVALALRPDELGPRPHEGGLT